MRGCCWLLLPLFLTGCGSSGGSGQTPGLTLPEGDRVVRVQPGACQQDCIISDPRYEAVTEVAGPERSAEQVGRDLKASLERSGWREMSGRDTAHSYGDVQYPYRFRREADSGFSYLFLLPVYPGTYGLAYDEDGDTLDGG